MIKSIQIAIQMIFQLAPVTIFLSFFLFLNSETEGLKKINNRPNIIVILADDMGYSDISSFGGEIETPNLDQLARDGVKFTQFYNASRCCPTRASLLTGLYPHEAGVGYMDENLGVESYQGFIKHQISTLPEILMKEGYSTLMMGKWHLGTAKGNNPWERGFQYFYGIPQAGGVYFWPPVFKRDIVLYDHSNQLGPQVIPPDPETFYSTDQFTDYLVDNIKTLKNQEKPFFIYAAYIAPHYPQQAKENDIQRYIDRYKRGWEILQKERYDRQIQQGIVNEKFKISHSNKSDWDKISLGKIDILARQMAVYAAQMNSLDQNIGKILNALKENRIDENTLVIFLSDNGAQLNPVVGFEKNKQALFGSKESCGGYAKGWANLSNTPFKGYKGEEYQGGIATPLIIKWPSMISNKNQISQQVGHVMDIVPTCLAAAHFDSSKPFFKENSPKLQGLNLIPYCVDPQLKTDRILFWEHSGNKAVRNRNWKMVSRPKGEWELYNLDEDGAESENLALQFPEKIQQLKTEYENWSQSAGVLPWPISKSKKTSSSDGSGS